MLYVIYCRKIWVTFEDLIITFYNLQFTSILMNSAVDILSLYVFFQALNYNITSVFLAIFNFYNEKLKIEHIAEEL